MEAEAKLKADVTVAGNASRTAEAKAPASVVVTTQRCSDFVKYAQGEEKYLLLILFTSCNYHLL